MQRDTKVNTGAVDKDEDFERRHVHGVYDQIASHFSSTRYKPWPIVDKFLKSLPDGAVGLDVGCGNGKYLSVNSNIFIIASDRSENLVRIASQKRQQVRQHSNENETTPAVAVVADGLSLPHPASRFDFAICIAVVHHLSTRERRVQALRCLLATLRPPPLQLLASFSDQHKRSGSSSSSSSDDGGRVLVFVWALEQKNSRRGWDRGDEQDLMVPWVMKTTATAATTTPATAPTGGDNGSGGGGGRRDENSNKGMDNDDRIECGPSEAKPGGPSNERTFLRYYHLYREGELEEDLVAAGARVVQTGYDRDNWWAIAERGGQSAK